MFDTILNRLIGMRIGLGYGLYNSADTLRLTGSSGSTLGTLRDY